VQKIAVDYLPKVRKMRSDLLQPTNTPAEGFGSNV
jgi:hypothetical protein